MSLIIKTKHIRDAEERGITAHANDSLISFGSEMMRKIGNSACSVTNYFVVNLSVADLLVTIICMPVAVSQAVSIIWSHGELMCKLSSYLQGKYSP